MTTHRFAGRLVLVAALAASVPASALVAGGGPARSDCYAEWAVSTPDLGANKGKVGVDCQDGDPTCDTDGKLDGTCTFQVAVCVFQTIAGCIPQPATVTFSGKAQALGLQAPAPSSAPTCGPQTTVTVPLRQGKKGPKPSKPVKLKMVATAPAAKPKRDVDKLVLRCVPNTGLGQCPLNSAGGPRQVTLTVAQQGTDLDNGWTGVSQDFPVDFGTQLTLCTTGCDASTNPMCTEDQAATEQVNGATFGAPVPLLSVAPVCLVSRYGSPKITDATANVQTGELTATIHLLSDVYITNAAQLCPRCSGNDLGKSGTCDSGARAGQSCRTEGIVTVSNVPGNKVFDLSSDCPPSGTPAGTLTVTLPATTGTSSLQGPKPCPGQVQDDACNGTPCNATCTNCASTVGGNCIDPKGGIKQTCCAGNTKVSCFPTAGGGTLTRTGSAAAPTPAWPDTTYPKTGAGALVATFCEGATGTVLVDQPSGLPGPGAIILPASEVWSQ